MPKPSYDNRIRVKYTAKWGVQIAGMILGAGSRKNNKLTEKATASDNASHRDCGFLKQYFITAVFFLS